MKLKGHPALY